MRHIKPEPMLAKWRDFKIELSEEEREEQKPRVRLITTVKRVQLS
ncbi:hypothetical protein [Pyrococcus yayanosii]|uniref:Uncharacterized protein n=1 Tax=Pyrococcus yayanosii (strain CH1 / JCM 16557) TaxID=529709 RepID=F8AG69_PYRYC|nr:hypothetical protein [Pyrococcus yayanosii]AEH23905.1 hypothetical protein PYCH_02030 [Pyrococcus yayanosii CH1]